LVEFGILLPLLLVLLLGVADFGRVFQAGIVMESAARAAAEAAALEYLRDPPTTPGDPAYDYDRLHLIAAESACAEARLLADADYNAGPPVSCPTWPAVRVCVHDGGGQPCGVPPAGFSGGSADCDRMPGDWDTDPDSQGNPYVEVRVCYRFTTLFNVTLPMDTGITIAEVLLQKDAHFTVADY
jgi:hypothetical protein